MSSFSGKVDLLSTASKIKGIFIEKSDQKSTILELEKNKEAIVNNMCCRFNDDFKCLATFQEILQVDIFCYFIFK
jgi:hypothetical protein